MLDLVIHRSVRRPKILPDLLFIVLGGDQENYHLVCWRACHADWRRPGMLMYYFIFIWRIYSRIVWKFYFAVAICSWKYVHTMQFDSPGWSAQFCFYSLMDARGLVVDFWMATKHMVSYSNNMGTTVYHIFLFHTFLLHTFSSTCQEKSKESLLMIVRWEIFELILKFNYSILISYFWSIAWNWVTTN